MGTDGFRLAHKIVFVRASQADGGPAGWEAAGPGSPPESEAPGPWGGRGARRGAEALPSSPMGLVLCASPAWHLRCPPAGLWGGTYGTRASCGHTASGSPMVSVRTRAWGCCPCKATRRAGRLPNSGAVGLCPPGALSASTRAPLQAAQQHVGSSPTRWWTPTQGCRGSLGDVGCRPVTRKALSQKTLLGLISLGKAR